MRRVQRGGGRGGDGIGVDTKGGEGGMGYGWTQGGRGGGRDGIGVDTWREGGDGIRGGMG